MYLAIYTTIYVVHILYFPVKVIFYSALFDVFIATIIVFFLIRTQYFSIFDNFNKFLITTILVLLGYAISISVPTVIDRSLSFYILEKINQRGGGIELSSFDNIIKHEYMNEYRVTDARITEQLQSGTIEIHNGCVKLTSRGKFISSLSNFFRNNLLAKNRLLMGEYTSILTSPLKYSESMEVGYKCE